MGDVTDQDIERATCAPISRKSDQVIQHEAAIAVARARGCAIDPAVRTQYEMEALESRHGPQVWDPAAQDAVDDAAFITNARRKAAPVGTGCFAYFPDALLEVARVSEKGNAQHGTDGWDRAVSSDELNPLARHLLDHLRGEVLDTDGIRHLAKVAWRALAALQKALEAAQ